jgi:hypothetical protein
MQPETTENQEPETIQYPALMKLKKRELANHLAKLLDKGTPRLVVNEMRDTVLAQKEKLRRHRIHEAQQNILWGDIVKPLQAERRNVRASLKYKAEDSTDPRAFAFEAYAVVLAKVHNRILDIKKTGKSTPSTYAEAENLPNRGMHWTDFVPLHIKNRIMGLFDDIPYTAKARRKIPFERIVTADVHDKRKRRLVNRTTKELLHANQDHALSPTQDTQARVDKLKAALAAIESLNDNEPVPTTWHGLF